MKERGEISARKVRWWWVKRSGSCIVFFSAWRIFSNRKLVRNLFLTTHLPHSFPSSFLFLFFPYLFFLSLSLFFSPFSSSSSSFVPSVPFPLFTHPSLIHTHTLIYTHTHTHPHSVFLSFIHPSFFFLLNSIVVHSHVTINSSTTHDDPFR